LLSIAAAGCGIVSSTSKSKGSGIGLDTRPTAGASRGDARPEACCAAGGATQQPGTLTMPATSASYVRHSVSVSDASSSLRSAKTSAAIPRADGAARWGGGGRLRCSYCARAGAGRHRPRRPAPHCAPAAMRADRRAAAHSPRASRLTFRSTLNSNGPSPRDTLSLLVLAIANIFEFE